MISNVILQSFTMTLHDALMLARFRRSSLAQRHVVRDSTAEYRVFEGYDRSRLPSTEVTLWSSGSVAEDGSPASYLLPSAQVRNRRRTHLSVSIDYLDGGDHIRRRFLSTSDASLCLCPSSISSNLQHVPGCAACHRQILRSEACRLWCSYSLF